MHVKVVVKVLGNEVVHETADCRSYAFLLLPHICGTELGLCLALEVRFLDLYADGSHYTLTAVFGLIIFFEKFLDGLGYGLAVRCQMSAAVAGILPVYEGGYILAVGVAVREDYLYILSFEVDGRFSLTRSRRPFSLL